MAPIKHKCKYSFKSHLPGVFWQIWDHHPEKDGLIFSSKVPHKAGHATKEQQVLFAHSKELPVDHYG